MRIKKKGGFEMAKEITRVTFNLPTSLVEQVDDYGRLMNINRTSSVSVLLSTALSGQKAISDMGNLLDFIKIEKKKIK